MSQALVRIAAGWLMGLMLAVAGAVVAINLVNDSIASPQQPVREYLDALQKRAGEKALGLLHARVPQSNPAMLDGEALKTRAAQGEDVAGGAVDGAYGPRVLDRMLPKRDCLSAGSSLRANRVEPPVLIL